MLLQQFQQHLKQGFSHLSTENCKLILAVSGGIDSVVMTDLYHKSGFDFIIAHCNFQLRGAESERDEMFVQSLALKYNKEVTVKKFDTNNYADTNKISIQEAARKLRYDWFKELLAQLPTVNHQKILATAHNADDNVETLLMFFLRGSGIHGLTGIPAYNKEKKIVRPLLFATRKVIKEYADENNINRVEDSSNATNKYTRNFLRNALIPSLEQHFPDVKTNLHNNIKRLQEVAQLYDHSIQQHKKNLLEIKGNEIYIPILKLQKTKPLDTIIWEIIKHYNFHSHQVEEIKKLFNANNSNYIQSSTHKIIKNRNWLIITSNETKEAANILIEEINKKIQFEQGSLFFEKLSVTAYQLSTHRSVAQLNCKHIQFPLLLRKWRQGDYFYPLGMQKKKKLSRFFIDEKLSPIQKENVFVLESNKKIIWIVGYRIDNRFKITSATKECLKIILTL